MINEVAEVLETKQTFNDKVKTNGLRGVAEIRSAIDELNALHPSQLKTDNGFGNWGFALLVGGKALYAPITNGEGSESLDWFKTGVSVMDLEQEYRDNASFANTVMVVLRMPLVTHEELSIAAVSRHQSAGSVPQ